MVKKSTFLLKLVVGQTCRGYCSSKTRLSNREIIAKRNALFTEEKNRQANLIRRLEKIRVTYKGNPKPCVLVMNKDISTPADCAKHMPEQVGKTSVLAYVNDQPWDMLSPLEEDCEVSFSHFKDPKPERLLMLNKVFWRSCSYLLGLAIERAFKEEHRVQLHSWPAPSIQSGSFVYDAVLSFQNWTPSERELLVIGHPVHKMYLEAKNFERLEVEPSVARKIFEDNSFKHEQVEAFAAANAKHKVILYRCDDHVDISRGPMIANTGFVRGFDVVSVHPFECQVGLVYRFQAISYPSQFTMSPFAVNVLKNRAKEMNTIGLPKERTDVLRQPKSQLTPESEIEDDCEETTKVHKAAQ